MISCSQGRKGAGLLKLHLCETIFLRPTDRTEQETAVRQDKTKRETVASFRASAFQLADFFPYLVRRFYMAVRTSVDQVHAEDYNLSASEWRTLTVLGPDRSMAAKEVVERSSMDKVSVSRALSGMTARGIVSRETDHRDKRRSVLRLTASGRAIYQDLAPRMLGLEQDLLQGIPAADLAAFYRVVARIEDNARDHQAGH
jgi:DNA-binding MarR family transcriptional regulator